MTWLLTGGAGYIGSHVARALIDSGRDVVILDDLSTGMAACIPDGVAFAHGSVVDEAFVAATIAQHSVTGVIHLAAKKAVGESVERPIFYYRENVDGVLSLLAAMRSQGVSRIVYSSSAAVYGQPDSSPVLEDGPKEPISPYGETKVVGEWLVADQAAAEGLSWVALRYFNVAGAGAPELADASVANLIPIVLRADSQGEAAKVFGDDYPTEDGTCVRDYIHVSDLADAHVVGAAATENGEIGEAVNIGTGSGSSVLEVVDSLSRALGHQVARDIVGRRAGDPAELVASVDKAGRVLNWAASHDLDSMTTSAAEAAEWRANN